MLSPPTCRASHTQMLLLVGAWAKAFFFLGGIVSENTHLEHLEGTKKLPERLKLVERILKIWNEQGAEKKSFSKRGKFAFKDSV